MRFSKWHGLGNDYLLVQRAEIGTPLTEEQVQLLCDYHFGVGSDGVLEVVSADGNEAEVVIWNPDAPRRAVRERNRNALVAARRASPTLFGSGWILESSQGASFRRRNGHGRRGSTGPRALTWG